MSIVSDIFYVYDISRDGSILVLNWFVFIIFRHFLKNVNGQDRIEDLL